VRIVYFTHSLASCWNHGNAHFLRGVLSDLMDKGHDVRVFEPQGAWSLDNITRDHGDQGTAAYRKLYPELASTEYGADADLSELTDAADLVIVHEWNEHKLVADIGRLRAQGATFTLLFHDTHHRAVTDPEALRRFDLGGYDGVLAFGAVLRERYLAAGWARRAWVWHEAADTALFRPLRNEPERDLVWVGNWGDGERTDELREFLLGPVRRLGLSAAVHGVRYPDHALAELEGAGIAYRGWLPNHEAPEAFARARATVHVPRRPYVLALPGIPTIRVFEALACGIPLVSAPWEDSEGLFPPGAYLAARDGEGMARSLRAVLADPELRRSLVETGLAAVRARHTCAQRVDELLAVDAEVRERPAEGLARCA
jgi:spore maturation protein CgeB